MKRTDWDIDLEALAEALENQDAKTVEKLIKAAQKAADDKALALQQTFMTAIFDGSITQDMVDDIAAAHPDSRRGLFMLLQSHGRAAMIPEKYVSPEEQVVAWAEMSATSEDDDLVLASDIRVIESRRDPESGCLFVMIDFEDPRLNWERGVGLIGPVNAKEPPYSSAKHFEYWRGGKADGTAQHLIDAWRAVDPGAFQAFKYEVSVGPYAEQTLEYTPKTLDAMAFQELLATAMSLTRPGLVGRITKKAPGLKETRFWGPLVWPQDQDAPRDEEERHLVQLLLVDLAKLPANDGLPEAGHLQFLIADNDEFGMSFDEDEPGQFLVICHPPDTDLVEVERDGGEPGMLLEDGPPDCRGIKWVQVDCLPDLADYRLEAFVQEKGYPSDEQRETYESWLSQTYGKPFDVVLLGTPAFAQFDVRSDEQMSDWINLARFPTGDAMMWGDGGEGIFLISPKDLEAGNFRKVFYSWDC